MFNIFSQKSEAFGLDISDLSLKISYLERKKGDLRLASFGETAISPGIIKAGEVQDEKALAAVIKKGLAQVKGEKLKTKYVILSLPEEKSFLDVIQLPKIKKEELREAVGYEIENYIPLSLEQVYFDCEIIEPILSSSKYLEVLIVATPKKIVDSYLKALKMAGLQPRALELECLAVARALVPGEKSSKPLLIIDFGGTRTTFIIFSGKSIRFTSTIPVSSQKLTESISKSLKVSLNEAEKLKIKNGLEGGKEPFKAMIPPLTDLVEQIKTHLDYWRSHEKRDRLRHNGKELEKILLCGGGANLKGLVEFLASQLKMTVQLGNPWVNIFKKPLKKVPGLSLKESLSYPTTLGLALRGINCQYSQFVD